MVGIRPVSVGTTQIWCVPGPKPSGGTDRSVWLNYFGDQPFTGHLSLHLEGSYRSTLGLLQFEQAMARSGKHSSTVCSGHDEHAVTLDHRVRLEQRWTGTEITGGGLTGGSVNARYRLTSHIPYGSGENPPHYIVMFNKAYTSFGPHSKPSPLYSDVTYAAHGWKLSSHWSLEAGYQFRYQPSPEE